MLNPTNIKEWDQTFSETVKMLADVPKPIMLEKKESEVVELWAIEDAQLSIGPVDEKLTQIKSRFDNLTDVAKMWQEDAEPKFAMIACDVPKLEKHYADRGLEYVPLPSSEDRKQFVRRNVSKYRTRFIAARGMSEHAAAKKRLLRRYEERLENMGHNTRKQMPSL